jgi:TPR repeat protein
MYEKGEFCKQDIMKALELFEKAANSGIPYLKKNYKLLLKQIKMGKYGLSTISSNK